MIINNGEWIAKIIQNKNTNTHTHLIQRNIRSSFFLQILPNIIIIIFYIIHYFIHVMIFKKITVKLWLKECEKNHNHLFYNDMIFKIN